MKFSLLSAVSVISLAFSVSAEEAPVAVDTEKQPQEIVFDPNFVPTPEKPFNFQIEYNIAFKEHDLVIDELYNGETIELFYDFRSLEPSDVSIVGVGGQLLDPISGVVAANITASQIGPINVGNNQTVRFSEKVGINMQTGNFLLVPAIYIYYEDQFMVLGSENKLVYVSDPKISIFNPKLLFSELVLGGSIVGVLYLLFNAFGATYLSSVLPANLLPAEKKKVSKKEYKESAKAATTDYSSWLPETHKGLKNKKKN